MFLCIAHLYYNIFLPFKYEKAETIKHWAAAQTRFVRLQDDIERS